MKGHLDSLTITEASMLLLNTKVSLNPDDHKQLRTTSDVLDYHSKKLNSKFQNRYTLAVMDALSEFYGIDKRKGLYREQLSVGLSYIREEFSQLKHRDPLTNGYQDLGKFCRILSSKADKHSKLHKKARLKF